MNNVLWEEEARAWRLEMRVCGVTAPTRVLFLKHRVRHSVWWDVRAYGQIDGSAQMFALVKNWGSGGMFCSKIKKKKTSDKTTHISVSCKEWTCVKWKYQRGSFWWHRARAACVALWSLSVVFDRRGARAACHGAGCGWEMCRKSTIKIRYHTGSCKGLK